MPRKGNIVEVVHPVPARLVPPGHRNERLRFVRERTPVRLREISPSETGPGPYFVTPGFGMRNTRSFDGSMWIRMEDRPGSSREGKPLKAASLAAWLESPLGNVLDASDMRFLYGTPVMGVAPGALGTRGDGEPLPAGTKVVEADRDRASASVAAFLENEILVAGDECLMRLDGPLCSVEGTYMDSAGLEMLARSGPSCLAPADGVNALWAALKPRYGLTGIDALDDHVDGGVAAVMPYVVAGAWERNFANRGPGEILRHAEAALSRPENRARAGVGCWIDGAARLRRWAALGSTGSLSLDDAREVAADCRDFLSGAMRAAPGAGKGILPRYAAYLDTLLLPAFEAAPTSTDDLTALEGIAP